MVILRMLNILVLHLNIIHLSNHNKNQLTWFPSYPEDSSASGDPYKSPYLESLCKNRVVYIGNPPISYEAHNLRSGQLSQLSQLCIMFG